MTVPTVKYKSLEELQHEAREAMEKLSLPGAPDEAWRRVPRDVLESFMVPVMEEKKFRPGRSELFLTGPGQLVKLESAKYAGADSGEPAAAGEVIPRWVALEQSRQALRLQRANDVEQNLLSAFHLAHAEDWYFLRFDGDAEADRHTDIEIVMTEHSPDTDLFLPFLIVETGHGADADLQVRIRSTGTGPVRGILQVVFLLEADSNLRYSYTEEGNEGDVFFSFEKSYQAENTRLHMGHTHGSAGVSMRDGRHAMLGRGGRFESYTLAKPREDGFAGQKISVEHYSPSTSGNVETRSVLDGSSSSVFVGSIKIPEGAAGSEGYEEHRSLLLSPTARVQSLPELEIVENDVSCSHASTVMEPEEEELFYLASRGIDPAESRSLLTEAFVRQVQSRMPGNQREVTENE